MTYHTIMSCGIEGTLLRWTIGICLITGSFSAAETGDTELDVQLGKIIRQQGLTGDPVAGRVIPDPGSPVAKLGRLLFFSTGLSGDRDVACVSCHHPLLVGGDGLSLPIGVGAVDPAVLGPNRHHGSNTAIDPDADGGPNVPRNSPTTFNIALYDRALFHDGRVFVVDDAVSPNGAGQRIRTPSSRFGLPDPKAGPNLTAAQARFPVSSTNEMLGFSAIAASSSSIRAQLGKRIVSNETVKALWLEKFKAAFPEQEASSLLGFDNIAFAIGEYERSQLFIETPWKRYVEGDRQALTQPQKRGAILFLSDEPQYGYGCSSCHRGDFFTDEQYHVAGFPQMGRGKTPEGKDYGRYDVTRAEVDRFAFRTPSLINVAETAPYAHSGAFENLFSVVGYHINPLESFARYDFSLKQLEQFRNSRVRYANAEANTRETLSRIKADTFGNRRTPSSQDIVYLVAFLNALTDPCVVSSQCLQPWLTDPVLAAEFSLLNARFTADATAWEGESVRQETKVTEVSLHAPRVATKARSFDCRAKPESASGSTGKFTEVALSAGLTHKRYYSIPTGDAQQTYGVFNALINTGGLAAGDIDGDCFSDLVFDAGKFGVVVYLNDTKGRFLVSQRIGDATREDVIVHPLLFDLNNDGWLDLLSMPVKNAVPRAYLGNGSGMFTEQHYSPGFFTGRNMISASFGDIDGDGDLDAFTSHWSHDAGPEEQHLWRNNGEGGFVAAGRKFGTYGQFDGQDFTFTPRFADINSDGLTDLLVVADFQQSRVLLNEDNHQFIDVTNRSVISDENGMGTAVADYDNDGDLDWFVSSIFDHSAAAWGISGNRLYQNQGDGSFVDVTDKTGVRDGAWGWGSCFADFNNDGHLDLFHVNGYGMQKTELVDVLSGTENMAAVLMAVWAHHTSTRARLYMGQGDGTFTDQASELGLNHVGQGRGISCFDYDRDGDIDIVIANNTGSPSLFRNDLGGANHFLSVKLVGGNNNIDAIGARIYLTIGDVVQMRELTFENNYISHNPVYAHFGVGLHDTIEQLKIVWPGRDRETVLKDVDANQFLTLVDPLVSK